RLTLKTAVPPTHLTTAFPFPRDLPMTTETTETSDLASETRRYKSQVVQVLYLETHPLYSHKDICMRDLVPNASDACDKLRSESLGKPELLAGEGDRRIDISHDRDARTLSIRDTGIGMDRDEVIANIGSIASSGTRRFLEALGENQKADARLIGQFGVGFYSAFVVADRVTVLTRRAGTPAEAGVKWESDGRGEYTLEPATLDSHGTTIVLHLKDGEDEFLEDWKLRSLVRKYS